MSTTEITFLLPLLLVAQGIIGGLDTIVNHEWIARLPARPEARSELGMHWIRELNYALLFAGLAWFHWHGAAVWIILVLLIAEMIVTIRDEFIENRTRVLPQNERILHVLLTLNLGFIFAVLIPLLYQWSEQSTALKPAFYGLASWLLSALAIAAMGWSIRDVIAWRRLKKSVPHP
jgi:hypothetical protein